MSEHYIFPGELAALILFVFVPPLMLALLGQLLFLRGRPRRAALAFAATVLGSLVIGTAWIIFAPPVLPSWLGIHDVHFAGGYWPVMPLAFIVVALLAPLFVVLLARYARLA